MPGMEIQITILIVDDFSLTLTMLRQILKQMGFDDIRTAYDGEMALEILENEDISLVFTDLNMPKMSGIELIQKIREKAENKDLPVIVVSGEGDHDMVLKAMETGADNFIVKPFAAKTIREKIAQVFSQKAQQPTSQT
jgi:two-component system chemotaxis response regulator CheY